MEEGGFVPAQPHQGQDGSDMCMATCQTDASMGWQLQHVEAVEAADDEKEIFEEKHC